MVDDVKEFYADYISIAPHLFTVNAREESCYSNSPSVWNPTTLTRSVQGLTAVLLSLKKCPTIRYQASSDMCKRLGESIRSIMAKEGVLFSFADSPRSDFTSRTFGSMDNVPPVLLLLDRRSDPVTPLLNQWTYQAMLHELLTITNNRVNLSNVPGVAKELKEVVISADHDDFYEKVT